MNTNDGIIHDLAPRQTFRDLAEKLRIPERILVPLGNRPDAGCGKCKGTGVKKILASGRRVPCGCTNPGQVRAEPAPPIVSSIVQPAPAVKAIVTLYQFADGTTRILRLSPPQAGALSVILGRLCGGILDFSDPVEFMDFTEPLAGETGS